MSRRIFGRLFGFIKRFAEKIQRLMDSIDDGSPSPEQGTLTIAQSQRFHRDIPAELEGPAERWKTIKVLIDFGAAVLEYPAPLREGRAVRDAVLSALLRRSLVVSESIRVNLAAGLLEPALGSIRTLMDIHLNMRLVVLDTTDRMAKRLAAYHYLGGQRHGQDMLTDPQTRKSIIGEYGSVGSTAEIVRSYKQWLEAPNFDDVRDDVRSSQYWHGYKNSEEAFDSIGAKSEYHITYDMMSMYLHAANVDVDYSGIVDGRPVLKALVERDPESLYHSLAYMAHQ